MSALTYRRALHGASLLVAKGITATSATVGYADSRLGGKYIIRLPDGTEIETQEQFDAYYAEVLASKGPKA